jgi:hypothetical protein
MEVTPAGKVISVKLMQSENAPLPIEVNPAGRVISVKPMQL